MYLTYFFFLMYRFLTKLVLVYLTSNLNTFLLMNDATNDSVQRKHAKETHSFVKCNYLAFLCHAKKKVLDDNSSHFKV